MRRDQRILCLYRLDYLFERDARVVSYLEECFERHTLVERVLYIISFRRASFRSSCCSLVAIFLTLTPFYFEVIVRPSY